MQTQWIGKSEKNIFFSTPFFLPHCYCEYTVTSTDYFQWLLLIQWFKLRSAQCPLICWKLFLLCVRSGSPLPAPYCNFCAWAASSCTGIFLTAILCSFLNLPDLIMVRISPRNADFLSFSGMPCLTHSS